MPRTKRIIKFEDSIIYNFIFFDKRLIVHSSKNKKPHDGGAQNFQEKIKLKLIS